MTTALHGSALQLCGFLPVLASFDWRREPVQREIAMIAYHFHWSRAECLALSRRERAGWLAEIQRINKAIAQSMKGRRR